MSQTHPKWILGFEDAVIAIIEAYMGTPQVEYPRIVDIVTTAGDNLLHTPASGKCVRIYRVKCTPDPDTADTPMLTLKLGSKLVQTGPVLYGSDFVTGAVDQPVILHLESEAKIGVNILYEEVDP